MSGISGTVRRNDTRYALPSVFGRSGILTLILFLASDPAAVELAWGRDEGSRTLWSSRDQFVRLEAQAGNDDKISPNSHPIELSADKIRALLGSIRVSSLDTGAPVPVFTGSELATLGEAVSRGLKQASPNQDIVFAIAGYRRVLFGSLKQPRVTTGRLFFDDGKLNVIFRKVNADYEYLEDRRLDPLLPGSRHAPSAHDWALVSQVGQNFQEVNGRRRSDWMLLDPYVILAQAEQERAQRQRRERIVDEADELKKETSALRTTQTELEREIRALRQELRALQKQQSAPQTPAHGATRDGSRPLSYEDRLSTLERLHDKGLLTDDEYQSKRQQILDEL